MATLLLAALLAAAPAQTTTRMPLAFEPNAGQIGAPARCALRTATGTFRFGPTSIELTGSAPLTMRFLGANPSPRIDGADQAPGTVNYLLGRDPSRWKSGIATFHEVRYADLYPGVGLAYGTNGRPLKGTYTVAPGADPAAIRWRYEGGVPSVDAEGRLNVATTGGTLTEDAPVAWQDTPAGRVDVAARFGVADDGTVGFALGAYDRTRPLVIDPTIDYSTYLGGFHFDFAETLAVDAAGNAFIAGYTASSDFPTLVPLQASPGGTGDAFVARFDPNGAPVYITYLGGFHVDAIFDVATDGTGAAYVTGQTGSTDFPITPGAFQPTYGGFWDAFVAKLSPDGQSLVYSSFLGGSDEENRSNAGVPGEIAVDRQGNAYVTGDTQSGDFPLVNPLQPQYHGNIDVFVTKINPTGTALVYSTYLGGETGDTAYGLAVDAGGSVVVVGDTVSRDFPVVNAVQPACAPSFAGCWDVFVARINAAGTAIVYSTYFGGNDQEYVDRAFDVAVDPSGRAYVTGMTGSPNFPVLAPYQFLYGGQVDAFLTVFTPTGALVSSTFLGGSNSEVGYVVALDTPRVGTVSPLGVYIAGLTISTDFPTVNPIQPSLGGFEDAFLAMFDPAISSARYVTYFGGSDGREEYGAWGLGVDALGNVYMAGGTEASDFPIQDAYQASVHGSYDAVLTKFAPGSATVDRPVFMRDPSLGMRIDPKR